MLDICMGTFEQRGFFQGDSKNCFAVGHFPAKLFQLTNYFLEATNTNNMTPEMNIFNVSSTFECFLGSSIKYQ